jgi:hypothetical protein
MATTAKKTTTAAKNTGKAAGGTKQRSGPAGTRPKGGGGTRSAKGRSTTRSTASRGKASQEETTGPGGLHMHTAHASIPIPYLTRKDVAANVQAAESAMPSMQQVRIPPPERLVFYGGLGALAVVGAVEWPVAAAIGVATMVARRGRRRSGAKKS